MNTERFLQEDMVYFEDAKGVNLEKFETFTRIQNGVTAIWDSRWYYFIIMLIGTLCMFFKESAMGMVILAFAMAILLVFCEDILASLFPFIMIFLMSVLHYNNLGFYVRIWWAVIPIVLAMIFHLVVYAKPIKVGKSFVGLALVSIATISGGVGTISKEDYFAPISLYYTLGLGIVMLLMYLLFKTQVKTDGKYRPLERLARIFYMVGIFTGFIVLLYYYHNNELFVEGFTTSFFSYRNYCASILLICMATPCYFVFRNDAHIVSVLFMYFAILMSGSRSGMAFGTVILVGCIIYLFKYNKKKRKIYTMVLLIAVIPFLLLDYGLIETLFRSRMVGGTLMYFQDSRIEFFSRAIADFFNNPFFGAGIGNTSNTDVFKGVPGSMSFYHNYAAQIIGSMGTAGIVAYAVMLYERMSIITKKFNALSGIFIMGYAGILLMSMTNPGEFCPFPDEFMVVVSFALIEGEDIVERDPETGQRIVPEKIVVAKGNDHVVV